MGSVRQQEDLQKVHKHRKNRESLLETLESIVVAFVLAFIFRAFIVEAFVIPTGSMAPTLYGAHAEFKCEDCGYQFGTGVQGAIGSEPLCPNCYLPQHLAERVPVYSGDRLLVLKYLYDFQEPQRWDVIVFHNPNDPSQNYIKRLIGLPRERVELISGNVTIDGHIVHKPDVAQNALWMLVHDTRYRATRTGWEPRWVGDRDWEANGPAFILSRAPDRDRTAYLAYRHRGPGGRLENIMDFYAYNTASDNRRLPPAVVADLGLRAEITAGQASSVVVIEMRAYKDRFRFELTAEGAEQPARVFINDKVAAQAAGGVLPVGRAISVLAANVDHKVMLVVGGRRVAQALGGETTPEGDAAYEPKPLSEDDRSRFDNPPGDDPRGMASEVRVGARGGQARLGYLRLDRDVYYLNETVSAVTGGSQAGNGTQGNPFTVKPDYFFVCGDNSPQSYDSRAWNLPEPAAPRRNLLGKAFFVYWPSAGWRYGVPVAPDLTAFRLVH